MKIDIGCGPNKREGFIGVDSIAFPGVDVVMDARQPWPWEADSVDEIHTSHFVEHLTAQERCHFVNECHRVLRKGGKATIIVPHWGSCRAYGDPTHQWPPVSEFWFYYLSQAWRDANAPHTDAKNWPPGYNCDFAATWGYSLHQGVMSRAQDFQQFAIGFYKEAIQDIIATLVK